VTLTAPDGSEHTVKANSHAALLTGIQASADVTEIVAAGGAGSWSLGNVSRVFTADYFAGWSLAVVYAEPGAPERRATIYDGALRVAAGSAKELDIDAPGGTASHLGFVVWGAHPDRVGSDIWMSSGEGQDSMAQELKADPFSGTARGFSGSPSQGTDVFTLDAPIVFPRSEQAGTGVTLRVSAWGDLERSDPFTLGGVTLVTDLATR
jgi:hypothetical protein